MKLERCEFVDNKAFRRKAALKLYGGPDIPLALPRCPPAEPWEFGRPHGHTYVMTREEEALRFLQYNFAKREMNRELVNANEQRLVPISAAVWLRRAKFLEEYLTRTNLPLVYSQIARNRFRYPNLEWNEACAAGEDALLRAMAKFDVNVGTKFSTYACRAILRALGGTNLRTGIKRSRVASVEDPDSYLSAASDDNQLATQEKSENSEALNKALAENSARLSEQERLVLQHRYYDSLTLEQSGVVLGVTKERVRQIQCRAIAKLKEVLT